MTRTILRPTLSGVAALALASAFASSPVLAQKANPIIWLSYDQAVEPGQSKTPKGLAKKKHGQKTPKGLATKKDQPLPSYPSTKYQNFSIFNGGVR